MLTENKRKKNGKRRKLNKKEPICAPMEYQSTNVDVIPRLQ